MLRIFQFLYRIKAFLFFIFLEVLAIWMIVANNSPQGAAFFNSSNELVGSLLEKQAKITQYFFLAEANDELKEENLEIMSQLIALQSKADSMPISLDSTLESNYRFKGARVISNSLRFTQNYLTLSKGAIDGIKPGMGVFNSEGAVGRIKSVSEHFSVAFSLLNTGLLVSSKIKNLDVFASVQWNGENASETKLLYVPRHVKTNQGDSVITSGFNAVFPEGILIGIITKIEPDRKDPNYLDITLKLSADFSKLSYVYLVENTRFQELDSLYQQSEIINEY
jgi:rod shape-determining protein MreC